MTERITHIVILLMMGFSLMGFAQNDSLAQVFLAEKNAAELKKEQSNLDFEQYFFEALQQKAIGNFDKAIMALEKCQNIKSDDKALNFELGKNYFELEKYVEAEAYTKRALQKDANNLFIQILLRDIYNKQNNFKAALEIQEKIAKENDNSELDLVILYIKNNKIDEAKKILLDLEKKGTLDENLLPFKESILSGSVSTPNDTSTDKPLEEQTLPELQTRYETEKSFRVLEQLLIKLNDKKKYLELEKKSTEGLEFFPAQPFVYLMNATALNYTKKYDQALVQLEIGLDYIVDDTTLEADFYDQMGLSYKGLKNNVEASKNYKKAATLREKKS
ncbi:hypothetical protein UMM65_05085 [Aureibaculum sp. 2210JD6-5]|uniref:tetratricopeptide repeat protein n=1 Tax=Aureibaculum sp. 2210JD6-5 TaxID=3103957 RepID=UPI002AAC8FE1|nr:hypothetical protein [Aureibaculum sp. 2210JD6-5]MDY7394605.1 hypothetical protein [Aureibaculum sp. 2210JD6-5]